MCKERRIFATVVQKVRSEVGCTNEVGGLCKYWDTNPAWGDNTTNQRQQPHAAQLPFIGMDAMVTKNISPVEH